MEIEHITHFVANTHHTMNISYNAVHNLIMIGLRVQPQNNVRCSISITSCPMELIFYSFVVLMSTSRLWSMSSKLHFTCSSYIMISLKIRNSSGCLTLSAGAYWCRILSMSPIFGELITIMETSIDLGPFLVQKYTKIL